MLGTYCVSRIVQLPAILPPLLRGHFHDFLATPVLLAAANLWITACGQRDLMFLSFRSIMALSLAAGCFWEFVTPLYRTSTTDFRDLLAYTAGGLLYYVVLRVFNQSPDHALSLGSLGV